jgi:hypothetical protein
MGTPFLYHDARRGFAACISLIFIDFSGVVKEAEGKGKGGEK